MNESSQYVLSSSEVFEATRAAVTGYTERL